MWLELVRCYSSQSTTNSMEAVSVWFQPGFWCETVERRGPYLRCSAGQGWELLCNNFPPCWIVSRALWENRFNLQSVECLRLGHNVILQGLKFIYTFCSRGREKDNFWVLGNQSFLGELIFSTTIEFLF